MKRPAQTVLLFLCTACTEEPKPPIDISSEADLLISQLQGSWLFESEMVTDCPGDEDGFDGMERLFERTEDSLMVEHFPHEGDISHFHPVGTNTLETQREDSILGCVIFQTAELEILSIEDGRMEAEYRAVLEHDGSAICNQIGEVMDYPEVCWMTSELQGERSN
jgi:hypothetical protein